MSAKYSFYLAIVIMIAIVIGIGGYIVLTDEEESDDEVIATETEIFSLAEIAEFNTRDNCWIAYDGAVYDVTDYLNSHPAGPDSIIMRCGEDVTEGFDAVGAHGGVSDADFEPFYVGDLE